MTAAIGPKSRSGTTRVTHDTKRYGVPGAPIVTRTRSIVPWPVCTPDSDGSLVGSATRTFAALSPGATGSAPTRGCARVGGVVDREVSGGGPRGFRQRVVLVHRAAELGDAEDGGQQDRQHEGELERGDASRHARLRQDGTAAAPHHCTSTGTSGPAVPPPSPDVAQGEFALLATPRNSSFAENAPPPGVEIGDSSSMQPQASIGTVWLPA
jgi:hypothetical protein